MGCSLHSPVSREQALASPTCSGFGDHAGSGLESHLASKKQVWCVDPGVGHGVGAALEPPSQQDASSWRPETPTSVGKQRPVPTDVGGVLLMTLHIRCYSA